MTTLTLFKIPLFKKCLTAGLVYLSLSVGFAAEKEMLILGGGGEPAGLTTNFDNHAFILSQFLNSKKNDWNASYSFNGGHAQTEKFLETKMAGRTSLGSFTEENFNRTLEAYEQKILNGELKSGDQLMIVIDTHGAVPQPGEKTHSIAFANGAAVNLKTLNGAKTFSMDNLEELVALASKNGVKLALIDLSCFSGNTLKIAAPNTCVISSTGEKQYGYMEVRKNPEEKASDTTFGGRFLQGLKKGQNLEDVFLKARAATNSSPDFPMISTDTGKMIKDLIYELVTPYLLYNEGSSAEFSEAYDLKDFALALCKTKNQYDEIKKRLDDIATLASIPQKLLNTTKLKNALDEYRQYQLMYEKALASTQSSSQEVKDIIARDYPDKAKLFAHEDGLSIISVDRSSALKHHKKWVEEAKDDWNKKFYQKLYDEMLERDRISKEVSAKLSEQAKFNIKKFDTIFKHSYKTRELADKVSAETRSLYDKLYRAQKSNSSNPCKDFIL